MHRIMKIFLKIYRYLIGLSILGVSVALVSRSTTNELSPIDPKPRLSSRHLQGAPQETTANYISDLSAGKRIDYNKLVPLGYKGIKYEWKKLVSATETHQDRKLILENYVQGWASKSSEDAWHACVELDDGIWLLKSCIAGCNDSKEIENLAGNLKKLDVTEAQRISVEAEIWKRWAEIAPSLAIEAFKKHPSPGACQYEAIAFGLIHDRPDEDIALAVEQVVELSHSSEPRYKSIILNALAKTKISNPQDFSVVYDAINYLKNKDEVDQYEIKRIEGEFFATAVKTIPFELLESINDSHSIPDGVLTNAIFEVGKSNIDDALETIDWSQRPSGQNERLSGLVGKMMKFDPYRFVDHIQKMNSGSRRDMAINSIVSFLVKESSYDEAGELVEKISNTKLKNALLRQIPVDRSPRKLNE